MKEGLIALFHDYPHLAWIISVTASIFIAVLGIVPSFFITAANILFFGFWKGTLLSFLGEALGAVIAFQLYRIGFRRKMDHQLQKFPKLHRLVEAEGSRAFFLILSLRLLPFVPSGLVSFAAAIGKVSTGVFLVASSLGKIPALLIEAWSVYQVTQFNLAGKLILAFTALAVLFFAWRNSR